MEIKKQDFGGEAFKTVIGKIKEGSSPSDILNVLIIFAMFSFYALTFFVPRFYGLTEKYVGVFVFVCLTALFFINTDPVLMIRKKDPAFIALFALILMTAVNILIVRSGAGCFFVAADFALIFFLAGRIRFMKWQMYLFGALYVLLIIYWYAFVYVWMFADYTSFAMNTNTAATFTVFSSLCALVIFDDLLGRYRIAGLAVTVILVKCLQIALYHRSRGAFVMLGSYLLLRFCIPKKMWAKKGFYAFMAILSTLGSLVFVAFYVWLGTYGVNFKMPFFYKNIFSGREAIWLEFWELFSKKPLTGIGTNVTITSFFEFNVHNAMYNILVIHGVIVFALMLFLMYSLWQKSHKGICENRTAMYAAIAVFAVCIESFFDVDLIWTDYSQNVLFLLLVMSQTGGRENASESKND